MLLIIENKLKIDRILILSQRYFHDTVHIIDLPVHRKHFLKTFQKKHLCGTKTVKGLGKLNVIEYRPLDFTVSSCIKRTFICEVFQVLFYYFECAIFTRKLNFFLAKTGYFYTKLYRKCMFSNIYSSIQNTHTYLIQVFNNHFSTIRMECDRYPWL